MAVLPSWYFQQQKASWRKIPFVIETIQMKGGRRIEVHDYIYTDNPWPEDLGRARQTFDIEGWLIEGPNDDPIKTQFTKMNKACNDSVGPNYFIHPKLGSLFVSLLAYSTTEDLAGNVVKLRFTFINVAANLQLAPYSTPATQKKSLLASIQALAASFLNFVHSITSFISSASTTLITANNILQSVVGSASIIGSILSVTTGFTAVLGSLVNDATMAVNAITGLGSIVTGSYTVSRYNPGNSSYVPPSLSTVPSGLSAIDTVNLGTTAMLNAAAVAANTCNAAIANTLTSVNNIEYNNTYTVNVYCQNVFACVEALRNSAVNPADSVRLLSSLATYNTYTAPQSTISATVPVTPSIIQATGSMLRRVTLCSLANATADYNPTSSTEVTDLLNVIIPLFDAEIDLAGDTGDNESFEALVTLKGAVVTDLQTRSLALPELITITRPISLPAHTLAEQLYGDGARTDGIVDLVNPVHPCFLPLTMNVLSY